MRQVKRGSDNFTIDKKNQKIPNIPCFTKAVARKAPEAVKKKTPKNTKRYQKIPIGFFAQKLTVKPSFKSEGQSKHTKIKK